MKITSKFLFSFVFLFCNILYAQTNVEINRKEFRNVRDGFNVAWVHVREGDTFFSEGGVFYKNAFEEYKKAYAYNSSNAELNYKAGVAALFSDSKEEAAEYLLKAYELNNNVAEDVLLLAGKALQYSGKYNEAVEKFEAYIEAADKKNKNNTELAKRYIEQCKSAAEISKDTHRIEITNLGGSINSDCDEYSIVLNSDGSRIFFGSRKPVTPNPSKHYDDTKYDENILLSDYQNGVWTNAVTAGKNITTNYCEVPLFLSQAEERLFIYTGYEGNGDIMVSTLKKGMWKSPKKEKIGISSNYTETSMCVSPDGNEIAFVRDAGKKGNGGKDIYIVRKIKDRKWSKPINAGITVNSKYDEESVRYSKGGDTLWFGSAGHNTMGGFDIFYSVRSTDGSWGPAVNAGFPLNTPWHELFYVPVPGDDSAFYFVSNRSGGYGGLDLYKGKILPPPPVIVPPEPEPVIPPEPQVVVVRDTVVIIKEIVQPAPVADKSVYLTGNITDSETGNPVLARIEVIDFLTDAIITTTASSDADGSYRAKLPDRKTYIINIRATGYLSDMKKITVPENYASDVMKLDVPLMKVKVGKKVVLNNIFFETGKAVLTKNSFEELDKLVAILNDNLSMKIEISGHTDNTGSAVINAKLSTERARAVVEYLVSKGIERTRMTYMGYGPDQPVADNSTAEGRAKNRRVEFKILEM
ncbi:MAG: OmpA family protein [Bacteroidales bacterium]